MSDSFNGYHVWLGIPLSEQPPNHYRLLGISIFESDLDVIDHAADRQMAHVRTFQSGRNGALSQQILNELAAARVCLLTPERKSDYDSQLRAKLSAAPAVAAVPVAAVPVGRAVPVAPVAQPVAPLAAKPVAPAAGANKPAAAKPAVATNVARSAEAVPVEKLSDDDDDPFGLRSASGRRPVAAKQGGSLFDDAEIASSPSINVDLARRPINTDILVQKLAIYGFVAVASLIILMVVWNTLTRNFGSPSEWFKAPVATEPASEGPQDQAPPAPAPGVQPAPAPAPAVGG